MNYFLILIIKGIITIFIFLSFNHCLYVCFWLSEHTGNHTWCQGLNPSQLHANKCLVALLSLQPFLNLDYLFNTDSIRI